MSKINGHSLTKKLGDRAWPCYHTA